MTLPTSAVLLSLALITIFGCANTGHGTSVLSDPPSPASGFLFKRITLGPDRSLDYAVYIPRNLDTHDPANPVPLILFLHGRGESGSDGQKMIIQGIGSNILWNAVRWPCVVLFPQKPEAEKQWEEYDQLVMAALEETRREHAIDPRRIALTGLSQGGHGTWAFAVNHPDVWCAIAPICGYPDPFQPDEIAGKIKHLPVWCFHGDADNVVTPNRSEVIVDALRRAGAEPKFSVYPGVNHNSWDRAYSEPELPAWLLRPKDTRSRP